MATALNLICTTQSVAQAKPNSDQVLHPSLLSKEVPVAHLCALATVQEHSSIESTSIPNLVSTTDARAFLLGCKMFDRAITYDPAERLLQRNRPRENTTLQSRVLASPRSQRPAPQNQESVPGTEEWSASHPLVRVSDCPRTLLPLHQAPILDLSNV